MNHSDSRLDATAFILVIVGALNWGLVAVARFDLVAFIFGGMDFGETNVGSRIVYGVVGLAGVYLGVRALSGLRTHRHGALSRA